MRVEHIIEIKVIEDLDAHEMDMIITTPDMPTVEVVGYFEMAKKQYIESKHTTGPSIYQTPEEK